MSDKKQICDECIKCMITITKYIDTNLVVDVDDKFYHCRELNMSPPFGVIECTEFAKKE